MILPLAKVLALSGLAAAYASSVASAQPAQDWRQDLVALDESAGRNIPNWRFDRTHSAGGYYQITDTNWRYYAPLLDIDLSKYPNALSAPEQLQGQVAGRMYADTGYMPWLPYNARLRRDLDSPRNNKGGDSTTLLHSTPTAAASKEQSAAAP